MAFKIKDNLDLYGNQLLNFALQSESGFYSSPQVGHMFYYTGHGTLANHPVVCVNPNDTSGNKFKALAFVDEIATNTAFTELADRVLTIEKALGEDTANVIDTWEEIQNFLKDINANDANLMTMLNSKLDKSGGTIDSSNSIPLVVNTSSNVEVAVNLTQNKQLRAVIGYDIYNGAYIQNGISNRFIGIADDGTPYYYNGSGKDTLIHSGNYATEIGDYYLKSNGGTINGQLTIEVSGYPLIAFQTPSTIYGYLGFSRVGVAAVYDTTTWQTLLHEGNIGEYALKLDGQSVLNGSLNFGTGSTIYRFANDSSGNASWYNGSVWKTIAFTDSDITGNAATATIAESARTLLSAENTNLFFAYPNLMAWSLGFPSYHGNIDGADLEFRCGYSYTTAMLINSSGNVTIGESDLAGTRSRLVINGGAISDTSWADAGQIILKSDATYLGITLNNGKYGEIQAGETNVGAIPLVLQKKGGNVLIGTTDELKSGAKLQVKGDLYVEGNIIATKEVSAGGAGQEGESGAGGAEVIDAPIPSGVTTYTITNTIGRSAVAVSLYEANVINGQTIWSLCLADIEVTDTTITVTFGSATSVNHKLVAVG